MYVCMKPAWNYLYEIKVNCGKKITHPVQWVVGTWPDTVTWFSFIPGSCIELLTNSGRGDHALHQSCLPVAPRTLLDSPEGRKIQDTVRSKKCLRSPVTTCFASRDFRLPQVLTFLRHTNALQAPGRGNKSFLWFPSPPFLGILSLMTIEELLWFRGQSRTNSSVKLKGTGVLRA